MASWAITFGTGVDVDVVGHGGAGAYECGEETALLESLEGKRGQTASSPPFRHPGPLRMPAIINNVETIVCVPLILERGAEWFAALGRREGGPSLLRQRDT